MQELKQLKWLANEMCCILLKTENKKAQFFHRELIQFDHITGEYPKFQKFTESEGKKLNNLNFKGDILNGDLDLNQTEMICVPSKPVYGEVDICIKAKNICWNIVVAKISNTCLNFEEKQRLGFEIEKRWGESQNLQEQSKARRFKDSLFKKKYERKVKQVRLLKKQLKSLGANPFDLPLEKPKKLINKGECEIGIAIENHRIKNNLNVKQICNQAGLSDTAYRMIIRGKSNPRKRTLKAIFKTKGTR